MHVGAVGDLALPRLKNFTHFDPVNQWELAGFYARSHVFVLASREEGLSLVQAQALASGLFVVCTDMTGGADLQGLIKEKHRITVIPAGDVDALRRAIEETVRRAIATRESRSMSAEDRQRLSWQEY